MSSEYEVGQRVRLTEDVSAVEQKGSCGVVDKVYQVPEPIRVRLDNGYRLMCWRRQIEMVLQEPRQ